jgi:hypothetical protein
MISVGENTSHSRLLDVARFGLSIGLLLAVSAASSAAQTQDPGRLYARVTTMRGRSFEGFIRWDQNEGHWTDVLDASKRLPRRFYRQAEELAGRSASRDNDGWTVLGYRVGRDDDRWPLTASAAIRMGHIRKILVLDEDYALLTLKSGQEQELRKSSTDLGDDNRGIVVDTQSEGRVELHWNDIDVVEFMPAPTGVGSSFGDRLYGSMETRRGQTFTGWITWDMDEIFGGDELDGQDSRRRRAIPFNQISQIERRGSSQAFVTLRDGESVALRGTNDVNDENRGIVVGDLGLGQIRVAWSEFASAKFFDPPSSAFDYAHLDGGHHLTGTVHTVSGEALSGEIRWDNDEQWTWEVLDGQADGLDLDVEFGLIRSIERKSSQGVSVTLLDGRVFEMRGSNDVNEGNKGVFVTAPSGETRLVEWHDFQRVDFQSP